MNEYMIAFSSFYKAVYAQEKVQEKKIRATLKKTPPGLMKSCGYALFLRTNDIDSLVAYLEDSFIDNRGVYRVEQEDGKAYYRMIS
ncbi:DUF3343 domain-containing protein [Bacilliculturomica massiliensis]|uniref:DUF3343 domain-containing protein n=1 Tax=Bacilliculturomica massiliensis TaxID=1917867 RepID=UPI00102F483B|nr:DUF3343 domain-containing protein [Bacilliculturomica massiliensis]